MERLYPQLYNLLQADGFLQNLLSDELGYPVLYVSPDNYQRDESEEITLAILGNVLARNMYPGDLGPYDEKTGDRNNTLTIHDYIDVLLWAIPLSYTNGSEPGMYNVHDTIVKKVAKRLIAIGAIAEFSST